MQTKLFVTPSLQAEPDKGEGAPGGRLGRQILIFFILFSTNQNRMVEGRKNLFYPGR